MSRNAYLVCHKTHMFLPLGTIVSPTENNTYFHSGTVNSSPNWRQIELNQLLWKFLADHLGCEICIVPSEELDDDLYESYCRIGDDGVHDITSDDFLSDWSGIALFGDGMSPSNNGST